MLTFAVWTKIFGGLANIWGCSPRAQCRTAPAYILKLCKKNSSRCASWRLMETGGKICPRKCHIWNQQPWFAYSLCNFYEATMMIKGSLLLSFNTIKHFRSKQVPFSAKFDG